jgi:hypothetical protein
MLINSPTKALNFASTLAIAAVFVSTNMTSSYAMDEELRSYRASSQLHPSNPDESLATPPYFPLLKPHTQRNGRLGGVDTPYTKNLMGQKKTIAVIGTTPSAKTDIEFKGEKRPALDFINRAKLKENDPFGLTDVIRFDQDRSNFIIKSTVVNINEEDLNEISNGNFVYAPYYKLGVNPNFGTRQPIGAFIVGTTNQDILQILHSHTLNNTMLYYENNANK